MNVSETKSADIRCTPMYQRMIGVGRVVKNIRGQQKWGSSGRKREI